MNARLSDSDNGNEKEEATDTKRTTTLTHQLCEWLCPSPNFGETKTLKSCKSIAV
jgi:hypothetical protein